MMAHHLKKVSRERTCSNCPCVWHDEPNQIKIAMSSYEPRPAKIYFIQYAHNKGTDQTAQIRLHGCAF